MVEIEEFLTLPLVTFYTVRRMDHEASETVDFFNRFKDNPLFANEVNYLQRSLREMGQFWYAQYRFFRYENKGDSNGLLHALPPPVQVARQVGIQQPASLRLYCLWLSENVVILLNGANKTRRTAQECPNVNPHFQFGLQASAWVKQAMDYGVLEVKGNTLFALDDEYTLPVNLYQ